MLASGLALALGTVLGSAAAHAAIKVESVPFIDLPADFNGFENIASSPDFHGGGFFPTNTPYSEGGITVTYIASTPNPNAISTNNKSFFGFGDHSWYANGGQFGYTDITLTGGGDFTNIQMWANDGAEGSIPDRLAYRLLEGGSVVASGNLPISFSGVHYTGFTGGGFDEVQLMSAPGLSSFDPGHVDYTAIDNISANGVVGLPEPATWTVMLIGFAGLGAALRLRRKGSGRSAVSAI
jgi:hypothetical protein